MMLKCLRASGFVYVFLMLSIIPTDSKGQASQDSLVLQIPRRVRIFSEMNPNRQRFVNYVFWRDVPRADGSYIHPPDTIGWHPTGSTTPRGELSYPSSGGTYRGTVDQTATFLVKNSGRVGVGGFTKDEIIIRYNIVGKEFLNGRLDVGQGYTPGEPLKCVFTNTDEGGIKVDFGLTVSFAPGIVDSNGVFIVGLEDFEGYHVWRGIEKDGRDFTNVGEMSKEEAALGEVIDSLYFFEMVPALRARGWYDLPEPMVGVGRRIDIRNVHPDGRLGDDEMFWLDRNAFNGFTYRYAVTTFDRGYNVKSTRQGLTKIDHCPVTEGFPYPCPGEIIPIFMVLEPQNDLKRVYAVPNPYRSGSSQLTAENYHNFPDNYLRIVNVPENCTVKIFTVGGDLVWEKRHTSGKGNIMWDTRNLAEKEVSSGVYIFRLEADNGDHVYGRIIIIR
ncbi:MAG: hypothetical protein JSW58_01565 [Candidatus Latescibacterota bacterium]|nr:MAG: hypothetical protein JSW58_01565 [Candidatus Latescibacterota bacterium]